MDNWLPTDTHDFRTIPPTSEPDPDGSAISRESTLSGDDRIQIEVGRLIINRTVRLARVDREPVELTAGEFEVLWYLAARAGQVVTRDELYHEILRMEYDGLNRCLDLRVSRVRKKIGDNHGSPRIIKSIRREGYLLAPDWD